MLHFTEYDLGKYPVSVPQACRILSAWLRLEGKENPLVYVPMRGGGRRWDVDNEALARFLRLKRAVWQIEVQQAG